MTRDDIVRMYEKANGWSPEGWDKTVDELERFAALVAAAEREACAEVCDEIYVNSECEDRSGIEKCAEAVRARRQK